MSAQRTETPDRNGIDRGAETDLLARVKQASLSVTRQDRMGLALMLAAGALIARAARTARRSWRKAAVQLLAGAALLWVGLRRRRIEGTSPGRGSRKVSDEAHAARERHDVLQQSETNPRGTSADQAVGTGAGSDEGEVRFTDEQDDEPRQTPHLDEAPDDPRFEDEEGVDVDLSASAMADEASEATGPAPEQAQPTQTEDTEPESSPPEDASHMEADVSDGTDVEATADEDGSADDERKTGNEDTA